MSCTVVSLGQDDSLSENDEYPCWKPIVDIEKSYDPYVQDVMGRFAVINTVREFKNWTFDKVVNFSFRRVEEGNLCTLFVQVIRNNNSSHAREVYNFEVLDHKPPVYSWKLMKNNDLVYII